MKDNSMMIMMMMFIFMIGIGVVIYFVASKKSEPTPVQAASTTNSGLLGSLIGLLPAIL